LKKFRYTVENFLPARYEEWGAELRELQDLLGEMHDLDVLWQTAITIRALRTEKARLEWHERISAGRNTRLDRYREKMLGRASPLRRWRSQLPAADQLKNAAMERLRIWASFRDPDISHSKHVAKLAIQIYDGLDSLNLVPRGCLQDARLILQTAALARATGFSKTHRKQQRAAYRLIRKLAAPLGLAPETLRCIALVIRFHRGSLPRPDQGAFLGITNEQREILVLLSGILRLADALGRFRQRSGGRIELKRAGDVLWVGIPEYSETDTSAEKLAAARHLLEVACHLPILIAAATTK